jgi:putative spermidine/putrescine transport system permease protein
MGVAGSTKGTLRGGVVALLSERTVFRLLCLPALLMLLVFYVFPVSRVLWTSVTEPSFGLGNYALLASPPVLRVVAVTARVCGTTTFITLLLAYLVAYTITHSRVRTQRLMMLGVLLPLWISVLVRSFAWITILRTHGLLNNALIKLGLIDRPLELMWNELGVVVGMVHYMLPLGILPLLANMQRINPALVAAARGLGASRVEAFWRVFLPLSLPGIVAAALLVFIFSLGFYVTPALLGGGRTILITEYISVQIVELLRWGAGTMLATMLVVVVFLLFGLLARAVDLRQVFGAK